MSEVFTYESLRFARTDVPHDGACLYHSLNLVLCDRETRFGVPWASGLASQHYDEYMQGVEETEASREQFLRELCAHYTLQAVASDESEKMKFLAAHDLLDLATGEVDVKGERVLAEGVASYVRSSKTWGTNYEIGILRHAFDLDVVVFAGEKGVEALRPAVRGSGLDTSHPLVRQGLLTRPLRRRSAHPKALRTPCYCVLLYSNAQHYSLLSFQGDEQLAYSKTEERDEARCRALFDRPPFPAGAPTLARTQTSRGGEPPPRLSLKRSRTLHSAARTFKSD